MDSCFGLQADNFALVFRETRQRHEQSDAFSQPPPSIIWSQFPCTIIANRDSLAGYYTRVT